VNTPCIFDLETEALPIAEQLEKFEPEFEADTRLKDPAKIAESLNDKKLKWAETAALHAERSRCLVIGVSYDGSPTILEDDEPKMIKVFWGNFESDSSLWIGHFIKGFDIPYLVRRSYILGVKVPAGLFDGKYLSRRFVDTMEVWGAGEWGARISLDNLSRALGVGKKSGSGKDFSSLWRSDRQAAKSYLLQDLALTEACAKKMNIF